MLAGRLEIFPILILFFKKYMGTVKRLKKVLADSFVKNKYRQMVCRAFHPCKVFWRDVERKAMSALDACHIVCDRS